MASRGIILKSCLCSTDGRPGRRRNRTCPRLGERGHGSWQFDCRVKDIRGRSTQVRRGGFPSQARRHPSPRRRPRPVTGTVHRPTLDR
jgi:hypothetical protein